MRTAAALRGLFFAGLLALGACRALPVLSPEAAADAPPPPGAVREFGIQRPVDTVAPIPPPRLPLR